MASVYDIDNETEYEHLLKSMPCSSEYLQPHEINNTIVNGEELMSCFHLNCRGLEANWSSFEDLIASLEYKFDFIGISECFKIRNDGKIKIDGYHDVIYRCREDCSRGGVALYINDRYDYTIRKDLSVFIPRVIETLFVEVSLPDSKKQIIGVIYRPNTPPLADLDMFHNTLLNVLNIVNNGKLSCTIMGDMNVDLLQYNKKQNVNAFLDDMFSIGFVPVILKPTRITDSTFTLIDHIYTNNILEVKQSAIIITDVADHLATSVFFKHKKIEETPNCVKTRIFCDKNIAKFKNYLLKTDFSVIYNIKCPNECFSKFIELYKVGFEECFPICEITPRKNTNNNPWYTNELKLSGKLKNKLYKTKLQSPTETNITKYKTELKRYNTLRRNLKSDYYKRKLTDYKQNVTKLWSFINETIGKTKNKPKYPNSFLINNQRVSNRVTVANSFNAFFTNIGKQTNNKIPSVSKHYSTYLRNFQQNSIFIEPVNELEVLKMVNKLKPKTSYGYDGISPKILKQTIYLILEPFTYIINRSLSTGIFPNIMKTARIIPLYKNSNNQIISNYRPISLLSTFSKILERTMFNKLISFFNSNSLFYHHQYGFRPKHSTIHPILHLVNHCAQGFNKTQPENTLAVFCDLSKAFDVIDHSKLLHKMYVYGIRGVAYDWFKSYLSDRTQYVDIEGVCSCFKLIEYGVPQGSILGPLLYLIYVNDIHQACNANILSFADDTTVYLSNSNLENLYSEGNQEISKLYDWFCSNGLLLNVDKTKCMIIRPAHKRENLADYQLNIGQTTIVRAGNDCREKHVKFLGLLIDENLTWSGHLSSVNQKLSRSLYVMKQVKHIFTADCLRMLYFSFVYPHLLYGLICWGNGQPSLSKQMFVLQKRAIRIIGKAKYNSHTDPLFKKYNLLKVCDLFDMTSLQFMFDYRTLSLPDSFRNTFILNRQLPNSRVTRQSDLYYIPKTRTGFIGKFPFYSIPRIWNKWSHIVAMCTSKKQLKNIIRKTVLNTYSSEIFCNNPYCSDCQRH